MPGKLTLLVWSSAICRGSSFSEAQMNVQSTSECAKHEWMCEAHVNVRSTSRGLFYGHPPACKPKAPTSGYLLHISIFPGKLMHLKKCFLHGTLKGRPKFEKVVKTSQSFCRNAIMLYRIAKWGWIFYWVTYKVTSLSNFLRKCPFCSLHVAVGG